MEEKEKKIKINKIIIKTAILCLIVMLSSYGVILYSSAEIVSKDIIKTKEIEHMLDKDVSLEDVEDALKDLKDTYDDATGKDDAEKKDENNKDDEGKDKEEEDDELTPSGEVEQAEVETERHLKQVNINGVKKPVWQEVGEISYDDVSFESVCELQTLLGDLGCERRSKMGTCRRGNR